jgi:hypothetical protein
MYENRLFFNPDHDQGVQTLSLPVAERSGCDKDDRRDAFLQPPRKVVKRRTGDFGPTPSQALIQEQYIQHLRTRRLGF